MATTELFELTPIAKSTAIPATVLYHLIKLATNPNPELTKETAIERKDALIKSLTDLHANRGGVSEVWNTLESELLKVNEILTTSNIARTTRIVLDLSRILSRHLVTVLNRRYTIEPFVLYNNGYYKVIAGLSERGKRISIQLIRNTGRNPHTVLELSSEVKPNGCTDLTSVKIESYNQAAFINSEQVSRKLSDALVLLRMYGFGRDNGIGYIIPYTTNGVTTLTLIRSSVYRGKK